MRAASQSDFKVEVPGIGDFTFARRTIQDSYRIKGNYNALTNGNYDVDGNINDIYAFGFVTIQSLIVSQPAGFDIGKLDPLEDEDFNEKVFAIFKELRDREGTFRKKPNTVSEDSGKGNSK